LDSASADLGEKRKHLDYYLQAGEMDPGNIHTAIMTGHCYLDLHNYEAALKYYSGWSIMIRET